MLLILVLVILGLVVPAICGIALEDTDLRIGRLHFIAVLFCTGGLMLFLLLEHRDLPGGYIAYFLGGAGLHTFFLRRTVQRLRDMGRDRGTAYLCLMPGVNLGVTIWLCLAPGE